MKVVLSARANRSLRQIAIFIARNNPRRAESFVRELQKTARDIGQMPEAFPLLAGYEILGVRRRVFNDYLIFYRVKNNQVTVIQILHGAQDYDNILFSNE